MGMKNVDVKVKGTTMTITLDLTKSFGLSKSGKTDIIASTGGNTEVEDGIYLGLNAYRYAQPKDQPKDQPKA